MCVHVCCAAFLVSVSVEARSEREAGQEACSGACAVVPQSKRARESERERELSSLEVDWFNLAGDGPSTERLCAEGPALPLAADTGQGLSQWTHVSTPHPSSGRGQ